MSPNKNRVILCGPMLSAVSGVSTHLNQLFGSRLSEVYDLAHFQVGSEGRVEGLFSKILRLITSPVKFLFSLISNRPSIVLLNTSLEAKSFWRDLVYMLIAKFLRIVVVYQVHGGALPQKFLGTSSIAQWFTALCLRIPDAIVLLAEEERESYSKYQGTGVIVVIPNAIDIKDFDKIKPKLYQKESIRLGYIGRLAAEKGIKESLHAMSYLKSSNKSTFKYLIAGSGPFETQLKALSHDLCLDEVVEFIPPVFNEEKIKFWETIDIFLFPTSHHEGLPYTILESLASGTPVITTKVGGIPDVIKDSVHGVFVEPTNPEFIAKSIIELTADREKLRKMSSQARLRAQENYTIDRLASQFIDLFTLVLNK